LHIEWRTPVPPSGDSQERGNSGVFLFGLYEIQVLDSYKNLSYADGQASAVYGQSPPLVNASRPPGEWQTYDVVYTGPRFEDGRLKPPGYVSERPLRRKRKAVSKASEALGTWPFWILFDRCHEVLPGNEVLELLTEGLGTVESRLNHKLRDKWALYIAIALNRLSADVLQIGPFPDFGVLSAARKRLSIGPSD
jgi:hypothetical protein